jgi:hypothetical protein
MIHSLHQLFESSIKFASDLNQLFDRSLFIPVMGDPLKSAILRVPDILSPFLQGLSLDDVLELPVFKEIFEEFPFERNRPLTIISHSPWTDEETHLAEVATRRFTNPEDIQKFVMPGRTPAVIRQHFREDWNAQRPPPPRRQRKRRSDDEVAKQVATVEQQDPEKPFVLDESMKFTVVAQLPADL